MGEIRIHYRYERGGTWEEKDGKGKLPGYMSRHHIIAYPGVYCMGVLALVYLRILKEEGKGDFSQKLKLLERIADTGNHAVLNSVNAINAVRGVGDSWFLPLGMNNISECLNKIAWIPVNGFIGPYAKLRADDPDQKNDRIPCGMPEEQKKAVREMIEGMKRCVISPIPLNSGESMTVRLQGMPAFSDLMCTFFANISRNFRTYNSKVSDWYIQAASGGNYRIVFYNGTHVDQVMSDAQNQKNLLKGKFGVRQSGTDPRLDEQNVFKVLARESECVKGMITKLDRDCYRTQDGEIRTFLERI